MLFRVPKSDNQEANKDAVNTLELITNDKRITQYTITNYMHLQFPLHEWNAKEIPLV